MSLAQSADRHFHATFDLRAARAVGSSKSPATHQRSALERLAHWFESQPHPNAGAILVLPTGGGKTFTALRHLCTHPLSRGYKVLWLAHTHHLLDQAFHGFHDSVSEILEPKASLSIRVVSATPGHFAPASISVDDDVVIATLQTLCRAQQANLPALAEFLNSAQDRLFVVFDEAHHSPAPSYRKLLTSLRERFPGMYLLGLTATPTYTDESKQGWLARLFPQGIIHQVTAQELMAAQVLARPILEEPRTHFTPQFDDREYEKWISTFQDIPEGVVSQLAESRERNELIANYYCNHREKYGKTIIFADRWYQCEALSSLLRRRGVRVASVYSHVERGSRNADERRQRTADDNAQSLDSFRRGDIDVLINVRMLTEGTDVPKVQSVFLTRPTTSRILLTQMIGRALRGPEFGGTSDAYIVSFVDDWKQLINWAAYDPLIAAGVDEDGSTFRNRLPLDIISIELVRQLAELMTRGPAATGYSGFHALLPVGWYLVEFDACVAGSDDIESVRRLVLVFESELQCYENFIASAGREMLAEFESESVVLEQVAARIESWIAAFFPAANQHIGSSLSRDLFDIARHMATRKSAPRFFRFEDREKHDLDALANEAISNEWGPKALNDAFQSEYGRNDRYWSVFYPAYQLFKSQCDICINQRLAAQQHGGVIVSKSEPIVRLAQAPPREVSDDVKRQVKERDGYRCVCCGVEGDRRLQVDHVTSQYFGGSNLLDNLQTLCAICNQKKGVERMNFLDPQTDLDQALPGFPEFEPPLGPQVQNPKTWERWLRRCINFFYRCGAVHGVAIGKRGDSFRRWSIELKAGNDPGWLHPHLSSVLDTICQAKESEGYGAPSAIMVTAPDQPHVLAEVSTIAPQRASTPAEGPQFIRFMGPLIRALQEMGHSARSSEVQEHILKTTNLPQSELDEKLPSGGSRVRNQIHWARNYLSQAGYVDSPARGIWSLTPVGIDCQGLSADDAKEIFRRVQRSSADSDAEEHSP